MRLSAAIKAGARLRPQAFGGPVVLDGPSNRPPRISTCALGAASAAAGLLRITVDGLQVRLDSQGADRHLRATWPLLREDVEALPCGCPWRALGTLVPPTVFGVIVHLNDTHKWSRRLIAQWVASMERK